ncbi:hypothetical protein POL68_13835 [Stigmatella sp. ncwal1]|uniref:Secreted protein n=1 Tax=Stigmatella ashevillensis TaxID=2995309 RepID=A0ABT5DB65_9BACT|nr:hypothetical protein [Stigmatella ashevillena]MDC0709546.1 hypothetical protein [Stigmatella ashevillena]
MRKLFAANALKACAFVAGTLMTLSAGPAFASEQQSCGGCGPAPCCTILWVDFCGCPWGESNTLQKPVEARFQSTGTTGSCGEGDSSSAAQTSEVETEAQQACFPQEVAALTRPLVNGSSWNTL